MAETYSVDAPAIALSAATALYMLGIATPSTMDADIIEITGGCDSTSAGSLKVELVTWTSDGTGTAYTMKKMNAASQGRAAVTTAKVDYTVAPTGTITVFKTWILPLPTGPFVLQEPLEYGWIHAPVSTFWGLRYTSTIGSVNGYAGLVIAE
ncbi:MAG: hypothetical protein WBF51_04185 [Candidatus Dormiibacterota bacterium]